MEEFNSRFFKNIGNDVSNETLNNHPTVWDYNGSYKLKNSYSNLVFFKEDYLNKLNTTLQDLLSRTTTPKIGEKLYIPKQCSIPRYKIEDYTKQNNVKRVWSYKDCDYIIVDKIILRDLLSGLSQYQYLSDKKYKLFEIKKDSQILSQIINYANNHLVWRSETISINSCPEIEPYLLLESDLSSNLDKKSLGLSLDVIGYNNLLNVQRSGILEILEYYIENPNSFEIIFDDEYLNILNEDGLDMDGEFFDTIEQMLKSRDRENIHLAVETLSNVNIEQNIIKIAVLLNNNLYITSRTNGYQIFQNQGFKSILNYFKSQDIDIFEKWQVFYGKLIKKYPSQSQDIKKHLVNRINGMMNYLGSDLEIKDVVI